MEYVKIERQSNIELLRIISIIGVIILHYNGAYAFDLLSTNSYNRYVLYILESMFVCAVNVFVIISGYFLSNTNNRTLIKPISLLFQVVFFKVIVNLIYWFLGYQTLDVRGLLSLFLPINYFAILYCALYIVSPYINHLLNSLNTKQYINFVIILLTLFAVYPFCVDVLSGIVANPLSGLSTISVDGSASGYSIVNFILMYIVGAFLHKFTFNITNKKLIIILAINVAIIFLYSILQDKLEVKICRWDYHNPLVIFEAIVIFLIFKNIYIGTNNIINRLSKSCFVCFLIHTYFLKLIKIDYFVMKNPIVMIVHCIISSIAIYFVCFIIYLLYDKIIERCFTKFFKKINLPNIWE